MSTEAEAEVVRLGSPEQETRRRGAQRAIIVATARARRRFATRFAAARDGAGAGVHMTGQHPSVTGQWQRHREVAARWGETSPALGAFRLAWGCLHMVIKAVLDTAHWVSEEPARCAAAGIIVLAVWKFR